jgi:hypothetical protein
VVDHINKNKLDNRLSNLRITDKVINGHNKTKRQNTTSKYFGVRFTKNKYQSEIKKDKNTIT